MLAEDDASSSANKVKLGIQADEFIYLVKKFLKYPQYLFEAALLYLFIFVFRFFPNKISSNIVAKLVSFVGNFHATNQIAYNNLKHAFSKKSDDEIKKIAAKSWENLGINGAEFDRVTNFSKEELDKMTRVENQNYFVLAKQISSSVIYVSAHIGNWELASRMLINLDPNTALIYRKAKNPFVENIIQKFRGRYAKKIIPKGEVAGFKDIMKQLKNGGSLGMLADQHLTSGVEIEFFGRKVRAPQTPAELAIKYSIPIIMSSVIRQENGNYLVSFEPPIIAKKTDDAVQITQEIYRVYERWITQNPEQWFWMHKRWR